MIELRRKAEAVDVLVIAEGTYPFVKGGVASWIYDLILNLPQYNFGVIFLGAYQGLYGDFVYPVPENVTHLQITYLFDNEDHSRLKFQKKSRDEAFDKILRMHQVFKESHGCPAGLVASIDNINTMLDDKNGFSYAHFLRDQRAWDFIEESYNNHSTDPSFIDYFWNIRNMHTPLWELQKSIDSIPKAKLVHTISTGYAGLIAHMIKKQQDIPLILSEHGIYTKERNIELLQSAMLIHVDMLITSKKMLSYQHQLWLKFFDSLARLCYHSAGLITSLFRSAQQQQLLGGADSQKMMITPNGVEVGKFIKLRRMPGQKIPKVVCFVGRFVRIKDIKTFIRAVGIMCAQDPEIVAWVKMVGLGDSEYLQECKDYINLMELEEKIIFINDGDMQSMLKGSSILILSSISEGMPLVLLEALAAGVPVIATDVGACKEIIEGIDEEDKRQGACGTVVSIGDAASIGNAAVSYLNDPALWFTVQQAGIERINKYYTQEKMIDTYQKIYHEAIDNGRYRD